MTRCSLKALSTALVYITLNANRVVASARYGIGINLNLGYGTAAIYFADGTSAGIVKVQGGPDYVQMMNNQQWYLPAEPEVDTARFTHTSQQSLKGLEPRSIWDHLPPWLGGRTPDPQIATMARMLQALQASAASYTGEEVTDVEVVFYSWAPESLQLLVDAATSRLRLNRPIKASWTAGEAAGWANGVGRPNCDETLPIPENLVLSVDYSSAALTVMLYAEDCGVYEELRNVHRKAVGIDNWSAETRRSIASALQEAAKIPVSRPWGIKLDHIDGLILIGEFGGDERLREVVKEVLVGMGTQGVEVTSNSDVMNDPLFAAAIGAAANCLWGLEHPPDEDGVRGRSELR